MEGTSPLRANSVLLPAIPGKYQAAGNPQAERTGPDLHLRNKVHESHQDSSNSSLSHGIEIEV